MKRFIAILFCMFPLLVAAQNYTVSGTITDASNGETLIGATVVDTRSGKGAVTNLYGRYSLTLRSDSVSLKVSFVGYEPQTFRLKFDGNRNLHIKLKPSVMLDEVTITAERAGDTRSAQMSATEMTMEKIKSVPVMFGEADLIKALQLMPGVQSGSEGNSGMYVRGGGPDENLFLLDGVPLYNVSHMGGFCSAFNADAIKNVTLYKGSFPARFGGRLSAVLDVTQNNGNDHELHGNLSVGLISAKFNDHSRLYLSFYSGDDKLHGKVNTVTSLGEDMYLGFSTQWGNLVSSLRWNYALTPRLFFNLSASYTQYHNDILGSVEKLASPSDPHPSTVSGDYKSGIKEGTLRADFDFTPNPDHDVKFGAYFTRHWFSPEVVEGSIDYFDSIQMEGALRMDTSRNAGIIPANDIVAFIEDDWSITEAVKLNAGLHLSAFKVQNSFYPSLQPRISGRVMLSPDLSVKAGYAMMTQYVHLLSTTSVTLPTDLWVPVTDRVKPMTSHQVAAGVFYTLSGIADLSVEAYYKHMNNIIEYRDGATFLGSTERWENLVYSGEGRSYGIEFLAQRDFGDLSGWVGYTWSRTTHLFDRPGQVINGGREFPAKYDRRHDFSIVLSYKISPTIDVSATWVYSTGNTASLATRSYPAAQEDPDAYDNGGTGMGRGSLNDVEGRNNYRMPDYHRLDLGANFHRQWKRCRRTINLSIYNVYNRQNPYMLYRSNRDTYRHYPTALVQLSLFPILPSFGYTLYF